MYQSISSVLRSLTLWKAAAFILYIGFVLFLQKLYTPIISDIRYTFMNGTQETEMMPVSLMSKKGEMIEGWITVSFRPMQGTIFQIYGDDCISELEINGIAMLPKTQKTLCSFPHTNAGHIDLRGFLHQGENIVYLKVRDLHGVKIGFSLTPSTFDPIVMMLRLLLFLPLLYLLFALTAKILLQQSPALVSILSAGFLLRIFYTAITPYTFWNYDTTQHIQYIEHMTHEWSVPIAYMGWEFHQGPLYYFLMAILLKTSLVLSLGKTVALEWIQSSSLVLSCITFVLAVWCGTILFHPKKQFKSLSLFTLIMACFPGIVYVASWINNDVLYQVIAFAFLGCLLMWWKEEEKETWLLATSVIIGLGFLTKGNAYLFLPALWTCVALKSTWSVERRIRLILLSGSIVMIMAGWLLALRYSQNDFVRLLAPGNTMSSALPHQSLAKSFLTFNPLSIITNPYTATFSDAPGTGRAFFFVFLFKSSLFGENAISSSASIREIAQVLSALLIGCLMLSFAGMIRSIRSKDIFFLPVFVLLSWIMAGAIAYRLLHPASSNQNFRFSILLVPLLAYFAVLATEGRGKIALFSRAWIMAFFTVSTGLLLCLMKGF